MIKQWVVLAGFAVISAQAAKVSAARTLRGITRPSGDVTLSFLQPGRIAKMDVKAGEKVKAGQRVAKQDDAEALAKLKMAKDQADSTIKIAAAKDELAQEQNDLNEKKKHRGGFTPYELQHAKLKMDIGRLSVHLAAFNHEQHVLQYQADKIQVRHMSLFSPIGGVVEKVFVHKGESVNAMDKVVRVVRINPLWVHANLALSKVAGVHVNEYVKVKFADGTTRVGKIVRVAQVADPASDTIAVRIEVSNKAMRPAGEQVRVILPGAKPAK